MLSQRINYDIFSREPTEIDFDMTYKRVHKLDEIYIAYLNAVGKGKRRLPPSREAFSDIVTKKIVSVSSRIVFVLRLMWKTHEIYYDSLFESGHAKSELVATFLAVLELVKGNRVIIDDGEDSLKLKLMVGGDKVWKSKRSKLQ